MPRSYTESLPKQRRMLSLLTSTAQARILLPYKSTDSIEYPYLRDMVGQI